MSASRRVPSYGSSKERGCLSALDADSHSQPTNGGRNGERFQRASRQVARRARIQEFHPRLKCWSVPTGEISKARSKTFYVSPSAIAASLRLANHVNEHGADPPQLRDFVFDRLPLPLGLTQLEVFCEFANHAIAFLEKAVHAIPVDFVLFR